MSYWEGWSIAGVVAAELLRLKEGMTTTKRPVDARAAPSFLNGFGVSVADGRR